MWISVHDSILGTKLRSLSKDIGVSANEAIGMLVRLWLWAVNNAEADGRLIGIEEEDIAEILLVGLAKGIDPLDVVHSLIRTGWLDKEDGLYIHNWSIWQKELYAYMISKRKHAERQKEYRARKAQMKSTNVAEEPVKQIPKEKEAKPEKAGYSTQFEEFWKVYPRKIGKGEAYKCYNARIKDGWKPEDIIQAAQAYANEVVKRHTENCYIKHPKTFLSSTTPFADYLKKSPVENEEPVMDDPFASWR